MISWFCSAELLSSDTVSDVIWPQSLLEWMLLFSRTSVAYRWTTFLSNNLATLFIRNRACLLDEKLPLSFRLGKDQLSWLVILLGKLPLVTLRFWSLHFRASSYFIFYPDFSDSLWLLICLVLLNNIFECRFCLDCFETTSFVSSEHLLIIPFSDIFWTSR